MNIIHYLSILIFWKIDTINNYYDGRVSFFENFIQSNRGCNCRSSHVAPRPRGCGSIVTSKCIENSPDEVPKPLVADDSSKKDDSPASTGSLSDKIEEEQTKWTDISVPCMTAEYRPTSQGVWRAIEWVRFLPTYLAASLYCIASPLMSLPIVGPGIQAFLWSFISSDATSPWTSLSCVIFSHIFCMIVTFCYLSRKKTNSVKLDSQPSREMFAVPQLADQRTKQLNNSCKVNDPFTNDQIAPDVGDRFFSDSATTQFSETSLSTTDSRCLDKPLSDCSRSDTTVNSASSTVASTSLSKNVRNSGLSLSTEQSAKLSRRCFSPPLESVRRVENDSHNARRRNAKNTAPSLDVSRTSAPTNGRRDLDRNSCAVRSLYSEESFCLLRFESLMSVKGNSFDMSFKELLAEKRASRWRQMGDFKKLDIGTQTDAIVTCANSPSLQNVAASGDTGRVPQPIGAKHLGDKELSCGEPHTPRYTIFSDDDFIWREEHNVAMSHMAKTIEMLQRENTRLEMLLVEIASTAVNSGSLRRHQHYASSESSYSSTISDLVDNDNDYY